MGEQILAQQAMSCSKLKLRNFLVFSRFTCNSHGRSLVMITLVAQKKGGSNKQNVFEKKEVFEKEGGAAFHGCRQSTNLPQLGKPSPKNFFKRTTLDSCKYTAAVFTCLER